MQVNYEKKRQFVSNQNCDHTMFKFTFLNLIAIQRKIKCLFKIFQCCNGYDSWFQIKFDLNCFLPFLNRWCRSGGSIQECLILIGLQKSWIAVFLHQLINVHFGRVENISWKQVWFYLNGSRKVKMLLCRT